MGTNVERLALLHFLELLPFVGDSGGERTLDEELEVSFVIPEDELGINVSMIGIGVLELGVGENLVVEQVSQLLGVFVMELFLIVFALGLRSTSLLLFHDELLETLFGVFEESLQNVEGGTPVFLNLNGELLDVEEIVVFVEHVLLHVFCLLVERGAIVEDLFHADHLLVVLLVVVDVVFPENSVLLNRPFLELHVVIARSLHRSSCHIIISLIFKYLFEFLQK